MKLDAPEARTPKPDEVWTPIVFDPTPWKCIAGPDKRGQYVWYVWDVSGGFYVEDHSGLQPMDEVTNAAQTLAEVRAVIETFSRALQQREDTGTAAWRAIQTITQLVG